MFKTKNERILFVVLAIVAILLTLHVNGALAQDTCFTVNGVVRDQPNSVDGVVNSQGSAWAPQTPFYAWGIHIGTTVSYDICVPPGADNPGAGANITSSVIYPLGGSGYPNYGYPKPDPPYNAFHWDTNTILLGDPLEYVQIQHDGVPFDQWQANKTFTLVHSVHTLIGSPDNTDWVSRIYLDAWIVEINRPISDSDGDGVPDDVDNCVNTFNPDQADEDNDGMGSECDAAPDCPGQDPAACGPPPITYLPELDCSGIGDNFCQGRYSLSQMGYFDGDTWNWNSEFEAMLNGFPGFPAQWIPERTSGLITEAGDWKKTDYRLDRRGYSDGREFTLLSLLLQTGTSVKYPTVYLASDPNCPECGQWVNAWHDETGNGLRWPQVDTIGAEELTEDRINFVKWVNTNETQYGPLSYDGGIFTMINYNLMSVCGDDGCGDNMWAFSDDVLYSQNAPTIRYHFPSVITQVGNQTFTINYDEGIEDSLTVFASDVRPMPVVPATITETSYVAQQGSKKSGKAVKMLPEETVVANILVREVVDPLNPDAGNALIVQWPEPDGALFGGMQLRVYVGLPDAEPGQDDFLFLDAPAQAGTVVFPQDVWVDYRDRMLDAGRTELSLHLMYRVNSDHYQNRTNSYMTFPIQFPIQ